MRVFIGITIGTALLLLLGLLVYFAKIRRSQPGDAVPTAKVSAKTKPQQTPSPKELITVKKRELTVKSGRMLTKVSLAMRMVEKEREGTIGYVIKKWLDSK